MQCIRSQKQLDVSAEFDTLASSGTALAMYELVGFVPFEEIGEHAYGVCLKLAQVGVGERLRVRVHSIVIELLENVYRHGVRVLGDGRLKENFRVFASAKEVIYISVSNSMRSSERAALHSYLCDLCGLTPAEARERYKHRILSGEISARGGVRLGLLGIVRSGADFSWTFEPHCEEVDYFTLIVRVCDIPNEK